MSDRRASALAALCGILALGAALAGALLAADEEQAHYTWPPANLASESPAQGWYAPLPLFNRVPQSLEVLVPCGLSPSLTTGSPVVLSTRRDAKDDTGLRIVQSERAIRISVGSTSVVAPWPGACPLLVTVRGGSLQVGERSERLDIGTLDDMPIVSGLFSNLDLATGNPPRVDVETRTYGTSQTALQIALFVLATVLAGVALALVVGRARHPRRRTVVRDLRSLWQTRGVTDVVVVLTMLAWWLVAPPLYDDGWWQVWHRAFDDVGDFSYYLNAWSENLSLGYWVEWVRGPFLRAESLPVARLPALVAMLLAWPLCRWCVLRVAPVPLTPPARWSLAAVFLVGVVAWEMTLRPEPVVCLLTLVSLAAALSFAQSPRVAPLVVVGLAFALGINAHPEGIVVLAPLLACAPELARWVRTRPPVGVALTGLVTGTAAVAITLFALDSDLRGRADDASVARETDSHGYHFWQEYVRYDQFDDDGGGPVVRHLSLALLILCAVALAIRGRAIWTSHTTLPARSVAVGLILLSVVPSKWPWHFGTLVAIAAVAAAAELAHLAQATFAGGRGVLTMNKLAGLAVALAAMFWVWSENGPWNLFDLQELTWADVFNWRTQLATVLAIALVAALHVRPRNLGAAAVDRFLRQFLLWAVPVFSFVALGLTIGVIAFDGARASWSPLRQNVGGGAECGLADRLGTPAHAAQLSRSDTATLVTPPLVPFLPCVRQPDVLDGVVETPSLIVTDRTLWPTKQLDSPFQSFVDLYSVKDGVIGLRGTRLFEVTPEVPGYQRADADRVTPS